MPLSPLRRDPDASRTRIISRSVGYNFCQGETKSFETHVLYRLMKNFLSLRAFVYGSRCHEVRPTNHGLSVSLDSTGTVDRTSSV